MNSQSFILLVFGLFTSFQLVAQKPLKTPLNPMQPSTNVVCKDVCTLFLQNPNLTTKTKTLTYKAVVNNTICYTVPSNINKGCLYSIPNQSWFLIKPSSTGNLNFTFENSVNADIDAAIWGPIATNDLQNFCATLTSAPISCDYSSIEPYVTISNAQVGAYYILLVTNFDNVSTDITISQPSTGAVEFQYVCPESLVLNSTLNSEMRISAQNHIQSTDKITQSKIVYTAGRGIDLNAGFETTPSAIFKAEIAACAENSPIYSQLILQPSSADGQDADVGSIIPDSPRPDNVFANPYAWTQGGTLNVKRVFTKFDFSSIPANAVVDSAYLNLYFSQALVDLAYPIFSGHTGDNAMEIHRVTGHWVESTITWNTMPTVDETVVLNVPAATYYKQDYPKLNVTTLVQNIINSGVNEGFRIKHQTETPYKITCLTACEETNPLKRPKIEVYYHYLPSQ